MDTTSLLVKEERIKPHSISLKQYWWSKAGAKIQSSGQEVGRVLGHCISLDGLPYYANNETWQKSLYFIVFAVFCEVFSATKPKGSCF